MKITFLTECNHKIGFGHLMRILAITHAYSLVGCKSEIIIKGEALLFKNLETSAKITYLNWFDENILVELIKKTDVLLIDSISISKSYFKKLISLKKNIIFIDDYYKWNHSKGIIINWTIGSEKKKFRVNNDNVSYLLGPKYTALREEFYNIKKRIYSKNIESVMITFGGGDIRNMTPKIISLFNKNFPNIKLNIIISKSYDNIDEIESIAKSNAALIYYPDARKMKNIMLESDIAIASGGQTLYELARTGLPAIAIVLIDNQVEDTEGWASEKFLFNAGWWNDKKINDNILNYFKILKSFSKRKKMGSIGQLKIDGNGAKRIVDFTLKSFNGNFI